MISQKLTSTDNEMGSFHDDPLMNNIILGVLIFSFRTIAYLIWTHSPAAYRVYRLCLFHALVLLALRLLPE